MELLKDLELIEVIYDDDSKAKLTFFDETNMNVREITLNKRSYNAETSKFEADDEKAKKVEEICQTELGTSFDGLDDVIGLKHDVYNYDRFCSLYEVDMVEKFKLDDKGVIFETKIQEITDDGVAIKIRYQYDGKLYESKMTYAKYLEDKGQWLPDLNKKQKQLNKFETHYGVPFADAEKLIDQKIMVEVKVAFKKFAYGEIKKVAK